MRPMRAIAIDYGTKRTGIAIAEDAGQSPVTALPFVPKSYAR